MDIILQPQSFGSEGLDILLNEVHVIPLTNTINSPCYIWSL